MKLFKFHVIRGREEAQFVPWSFELQPESRATQLFPFQMEVGSPGADAEHLSFWDNFQVGGVGHGEWLETQGWENRFSIFKLFFS